MEPGPLRHVPAPVAQPVSVRTGAAQPDPAHLALRLVRPGPARPAFWEEIGRGPGPMGRPALVQLSIRGHMPEHLEYLLLWCPPLAKERAQLPMHVFVTNIQSPHDTGEGFGPCPRKILRNGALLAVRDFNDIDILNNYFVTERPHWLDSHF